MTNRPLTVVQIGPHPPTGGGIATHVARLHARCRAVGIDSTVINPYGGSPQPHEEFPAVVTPRGSSAPRALEIVRQVARRRPNVLHIHASRLGRLSVLGPLVLMAARESRTVVTVHGSIEDSWKKYSRLKRLSVKSVARRIDRLIVVSGRQQPFLERELNVPADRIHVIPAFIPPMALSQPLTVSDVPVPVQNLRTSFPKVAVAAGNIVPLYGFDRVLDALERGSFSGLGVALVFYGNEDRRYREAIEARAASLGNVAIVRNLSERQFVATLRLADIFIRPTTEEGDSVALREAIGCGCQIVASSVYARPAGTELFDLTDNHGLIRALERCIADGAMGRAMDRTDFGPDVLNLYLGLANARAVAACGPAHRGIA
jgi:glycosyltransferase involved in cell wall biosynthesis